jgi:hypothetical protein
MTWVPWLIFLAGTLPFAQEWRALRRTSLVHALYWAAAAWLASGAVVVLEQAAPGSLAAAARYLALCLVGCAGVAVLGARRPGVAAWDFVVLGLLAVLLLFLAEGVIVGGELQLGPVRITFLGLTLAIGIVNYLRTRLAPAAMLLALACGWELWELARRAGGSGASDGAYAGVMILLVPLAAEVCWLFGRPSGCDADALWLSFRNNFGTIWGLRVREQFNRAAANAALPLELAWNGLRPINGDSLPSHKDMDAAQGILRALLKRFGPEAPGEIPEIGPAGASASLPEGTQR